jgi:hypothetical protein
VDPVPDPLLFFFFFFFSENLVAPGITFFTYNSLLLCILNVNLVPLFCVFVNIVLTFFFCLFVCFNVRDVKY